MEIAIVGAGLSGSNTLKTLLMHEGFTADDRIDVFEPRAELGPGLPYATNDDEAILLNTTSKPMSVDTKNPNDFVDWLDRHYEQPENDEGMVPRRRYGRYLKEHFAPYFAHEQVVHIQSKVEDLDILDDGSGKYVYRLKTADGWQDQIYDAVFLAIGHPDYNDYYGLKGAANYIHNPYPMKETLNRLDNDQKVAVIGSGATGIDLMRYVFTHYDLKQPLSFYDVKEPFYCVSIPYEKNDLTYSLTNEWIVAEKAKNNGFIPLANIIETVQSDLSDVDIQAVYDHYKPGTLDLYREAYEVRDQDLAAVQWYAGQSLLQLPHLYNALTEADRRQYMAEYHGPVNFFKSKVPYYSYKWLFELMDAGKLEAGSGLVDVQQLENGQFQIVTEQDEIEVDVLINATGFTQNLVDVAQESTLVNNLLRKKIILPHVDDKFVLITWPQSQVMNQRYGVMDNLIFSGLLIGGTQHENNDASQTIDHARFIANAWMDRR